MTELLLPLRSNAGWFATDDTERRLLRRIKNYLVIYDYLHIERGCFTSVVWEQGASFWGVLPDGSPRLPTDSFRRRFDPGTQLTLSLGPMDEGAGQPVTWSGALRHGFQADFRSLLRSRVPFTTDALVWRDVQLTATQQQQVRAAVEQDLQDPLLKECLPSATSNRRGLVEALHCDSLLTQQLGMPFAAEPVVEEFIRLRNRKALHSLQLDASDSAYSAWVRIGLPDFGSFTWDQLWSMRDSRPGRDFRRMMERVSNGVCAAIQEGASAVEQQRIAERGVSRELILELTKPRKTAPDVLLSVGLNLLPGFGDVASVVNDSRLWWQDRHPGLHCCGRVTLKIRPLGDDQKSAPTFSMAQRAGKRGGGGGGWWCSSRNRVA